MIEMFVTMTKCLSPTTPDAGKWAELSIPGRPAGQLLLARPQHSGDDEQDDE